MKNQTYDIIGDIHGCHDKLLLLLEKLGYRMNNECFRHPEGRKVAFLGDFIDPKGSLPHNVPAVLEIVKTMVEKGEAVAIMGNHEFNAVAYATPDGKGYLRPHVEDKDKGLKITFEAFEGGCDGKAWKELIEWFKTLPLYLELDGFRLIHAYWNEEAVRELKGKSLTDPAFLKAAATKGTDEYKWVELVLKGYEIPMPGKHTYLDHTGIRRADFRARWFDLNPVGKLASELVFPAGNYAIPAEPVPEETANLIPGYDTTARPVFFGHYFKPEDCPFEPELDNLACLDFSVAKGGPMVAYRWDGERTLLPEKYIAV